jgi:sugar O-acyltransferase (sialic acid O-acetyltransferase NeuD family)
LPTSEYRIRGFIDTQRVDLSHLGPAGVVVGDERSCRIDPNDRFVLGIGRIDLRRKVVTALRDRGARFERVIHPSAVIAATADIGEGAVLCPFALLTDRVRVHDFAMLNLYASCGHDAAVGEFSVMSPYATLNGSATLEAEVFMGTHATVIPGKCVGARSTIGANSAVIDDVAPDSVMVGVPARPLHR